MKRKKINSKKKRQEGKEEGQEDAAASYMPYDNEVLHFSTGRDKV